MSCELTVAISRKCASSVDSNLSSIGINGDHQCSKGLNANYVNARKTNCSCSIKIDGESKINTKKSYDGYERIMKALQLLCLFVSVWVYWGKNYAVSYTFGSISIIFSISPAQRGADK